jgi:hypothetical protein
MRTLATTALLLVLSGCWSAGTASQPGSASTAPGSAQHGPEPVLYARDGSVVPIDPAAPAASSVAGRPNVANAAPIHGLQPREESRMQLLDLYQRVVGEKESLALEVRALDATLVESKSAQASLANERDLLRARVEALEAQVAQAEDEKNDLAARLTTAQIRRLEAEKLLLESKLATARASERAEAFRKESGARSPREAGSAKTGERHEPEAREHASSSGTKP